MTLWREIQKRNFTDCSALYSYLELDEENRKKVLNKSPFTLNLPLRLAAKIKKNSLDDPIFRQFVPLCEENEIVLNYSPDPLNEKDFFKKPKLLHKYPKRALLVLTSACAMHCRFCFRRSFPYEKSIKGYEAELKAIADDTTLEEIILSGGDPLSLSNEHLGELFEHLGAIPHIQRIRFHTRFPIGIPERIDAEFLQLLAQCRKQIFFVIHCNHANELDEDVLKALKEIQRLGVPLLNQSVLLKGVNDSKESLLALSNRLVNAGIMPYYLHQLDRVAGAHHFEVEEREGLKMLSELNEQLSGYAVPKYVREMPGERSKVVVASAT